MLACAQVFLDGRRRERLTLQKQVMMNGATTTRHSDQKWEKEKNKNNALSFLCSTEFKRGNKRQWLRIIHEQVLNSPPAESILFHVLLTEPCNWYNIYLCMAMQGLCAGPFGKPKCDTFFCYTIASQPSSESPLKRYICKERRPKMKPSWMMRTPTNTCTTHMYTAP